MLLLDVGSAVMSSGAAVTSEEEMSLKSLTMFPLQQSADELHAPAALQVAPKYLNNAKKRLYITLLFISKYRLEDITKVHYMYLPDLYI